MLIEPYEDWDPPAPSTIYCKIKNIPYNVFKYWVNQGIRDPLIEQIQLKLSDRTFCCIRCAKYEEYYCTRKKRRAAPEAICKSFYPIKGIKYMAPKQKTRPTTVEKEAKSRKENKTGQQNKVPDLNYNMPAPPDGFKYLYELNQMGKNQKRKNCNH